MPEVLLENKQAIRLWSDINLLGSDVAFMLNDITLDRQGQSDLLLKLRELFSETAKIKAEKTRAATNG